MRCKVDGGLQDIKEFLEMTQGKDGAIKQKTFSNFVTHCDGTSIAPVGFRCKEYYNMQGYICSGPSKGKCHVMQGWTNKENDSGTPSCTAKCPEQA